ncbi:MAG: class I SAM-dependent methyltransferase, partial [Thermomicrobiales bacterium]
GFAAGCRLGASGNVSGLARPAPPTPATTFAMLQLLRQLPETDGPALAPTRGARLRGRLHSRPRDRAAIRYHYDVSNDFYALWLDTRMTYSCAYFEHGDEGIDAAQEAKYDLICRKLRLRPGERLLDIGCGWGGLAIFAAERYGVEATGVTLSVRQAELAKERIAAAGLTDRVSIVLDDYRNLPSGMPFDKIVSVGMFEHVGRPRLPEYFTTAHHLLKAGGLFLNHGIAQQHDFHTPARRVIDREMNARTSFVWNYVFPDGELVPISEALGVAERAGWEVRDVESLREHYAMTLRHWNRRLTAHEEEAKRLVGEESYRVWRLYMGGAAYSFAHERISIYQALFTKPDPSGNAHIPLTRRDIYTRNNDA